MRVINRNGAVCAMVVCASFFSGGGCGGAGFLGLQDYQRDLLFGIGGGLVGAVIRNATPPPADDGNGDPALNEPGPAGPQGPQGPPGPPVFAIMVDTFYGGMASDLFGVVPVRVDEPALGPDDGPLAFSVAIPSNFVAQNPVNMRLILYRTGPCNDGCFIITVDGRRAQLGDAEPQCFGGDAADCSDARRWVMIHGPCGQAGDADNVEQFLVIDLPLNGDGMMLPDVEAGDLLAFELGTMSHDGGTYSILGVEFSDAGAELSMDATVFISADEIPEMCLP